MSKFFCVLCGANYSSISSLTANSCSKNKEGNKKHILYEGTEKPKYTCKHCGNDYSSISSLTANSCRNSPTKYHVPL